jgi:hypothetical protein
MEDGECCPECGHALPVDGPAHFSDCSYFSLDDDRDEESPVSVWAMRREMDIDRLLKAVA